MTRITNNNGVANRSDTPGDNVFSLSQAPPGVKRKVILLIDPDETTSRAVQLQLKTEFQVLSVPDADRAMQLIRSECVDIVILARCLPHLDCLDVLRKIKQETPSLPVIILALSPSEDLVIAAFRAGAQDFLKKPLVPEELVQSIRRIQPDVIGGGLAGKRAHSIRNGYKAGWSTRFGETLTGFSRRFLRKDDRLLTESASPSGRETIPVSTEEVETDAKPDSSPTMVQSGPTALRFNFFGSFHIPIENWVIDYWPGKKGKAILAYLAYNHKRRIYRDVLMDIFWPDSSPDSARNCLNVCVHGIRQLFQEFVPDQQFVLFKNDCYFFNPDLEITMDVEEFLLRWRLGQSTEREKGIEAALGEYELAAALYKGDFMQDDIYEEWTTLDRENLKEIYLVVLDRLSKYYSLDGKPMTAVNLCKTILAKDNCREDIHRRLMKCYCRLGYRDRALRQFYKCSEALEKELEVEPTKATLELFAKIKQDLPEKN